MKIVNANKQKVTFSDLKRGDVFKLGVTNNFYMKTEFRLGYNTSKYNTVNIENGTLFETQDNTEVIPIDCELVIK